MSSYLTSLLSSAFGSGAAFDSSDESDGENCNPTTTQCPTKVNVSEPPQSGVVKRSAADSACSSVHWLSVETDEKEARVVCDQRAAKEVLSKCSDTTPLNLISIFGAARQGKSFLMNMLAGEDRLFKISSSQDPCTQGVDISRKVVSWGAFHRRDGIALKEKPDRRSLANATSETAPKIAFVDVEGQGDRDLTYDANLVCPVVLTSRCVLFNWKDSLQRDRVLNLLAVMQRAAYNVATEEEGGYGGPGGIPQSKIFGHLHIVFRDWSYQGTRESVYSTLFTPERSLAADAVARNQIRSVLEGAFESITIWLLPPPVDRTTDLHKELRESDLSDGFKAQVQALRHVLAEQVKTPQHFCGKILTGPKIAALVPSLVQTLNAGEQVLPRSAYANLIVSEISRVQISYLKKLQKVLASVKEKATSTPVTTLELQGRVDREIHVLQRAFDRWLHSLGASSITAEAAEKFHQHCQKGAEEVLALNQEHLLAAHVHAAGKRAMHDFDEAFTASILARLPMAPERVVARHGEALREAEERVLAVVKGETTTHALPVPDVLSSLQNHAALALSQVEARNQEALGQVREQEQAAFEEAKTGFQNVFFLALKKLNARGYPIEEAEFTEAYAAALTTATESLRQSMHPELSSPTRYKELEGFLKSACEAVKGEQGAMYQLGTTKGLLERARAEAESEIGRLKEMARKERERLQGELEDAQAEVGRLRGEKETAGRAQAVAVQDLKEQGRRAAAEGEKWEARVRVLEKALAEEREGWGRARATLEEERAALAKQVEMLQAQASQALRKRKAVEEEAERIVKARHARPASLVTTEASGGAEGATGEKEEDEAEDKVRTGMEVEEEDTPVVREGVTVRAGGKQKGKAAGAPGGGATKRGKGRAVGQTSPEAQRQVLERAREEERKRIEESTAKRVTRARR